MNSSIIRIMFVSKSAQTKVQFWNYDAGKTERNGYLIIKKMGKFIESLRRSGIFFGNFPFSIRRLDGDYSKGNRLCVGRWSINV